MADWLSLMGAGVEGASLPVERAIAEFRAGRPVIVEAAQDAATRASILVASVESLDPPALETLVAMADPQARLILSGPRLEKLGAGKREGGALALTGADFARVAALALGRKARLDAPPAPLTAAEKAALRLSHLATLLPACIAAPLAPGALDSAPVVRVSVPAICAYTAAQTAGLHIVSRAPVPLDGAPVSEMVVFRGGQGLRDHAAVIVGKPDFAKPVPVRIHSACLTGDVFGSLKCDCGDQLRMTARHMAEGEGGIILYLDQEGRANGLASKIRAYALQAEGYDTYDADELLGFDHDQRLFDFAAEMLKQLGVRTVKLLTNNPVKIAALEGAGVAVVASERVHGRTTAQNQAYLEAKRDKAGHKFAADIALSSPEA